MKKKKEVRSKVNKVVTHRACVLRRLFKNNRVVGVVGNRSTGKSSLVLHELIELKADMKRKNIDMPIYVFGVERQLQPYLETEDIHFLFNKEDIWESSIRDAIIYVDEIANFVSTQTRDKQTEKFKRFIVRITHQNCWLIMSTSEPTFWNKLACSLINAFIIKETELESLVNGTWLKRLVYGLERTSDYRVDMPINTYFTLESNSLTGKHTFTYNSNLDSKVNNTNPFK